MLTREELKNRKRRVIWCSDGDDLAITANYNDMAAHWHKNPIPYTPFPKCFNSKDDFLKVRMKGKIDGTSVDVISFQGFIFVPNWDFPKDNTKALGPDPLFHVVDFAHINNMEFFYSLRMNDIHHVVYPGKFFWSDFRLNNLHLLQGNIEKKWFDENVIPWIEGKVEMHPLNSAFEAGKNFYFPYEGSKPSDCRHWGAYDWCHKEVRDYFLNIVKEACQRYDLDGIELDYGRTYPFFGSKSRMNSPLMTDFIGQVRLWLNEWGEKRGRPALLAVKVPESPEESLNMGLDSYTWMDQNLVDIIIVGFGGRPFSCTMEEWVCLAKKNNIKLYGCIEGGWPVQLKTEVIRAMSQFFLKNGADGVSLYDHFYQDYEIQTLPDGWSQPGNPEALNDIGDIDTLKYLDKTYFADFYGNSYLPVKLSTESASCTVPVRLNIAEDPSAAYEVNLLVQWENSEDADRISIKLNGQSVGTGKPFVMDRENDIHGWYAHKTNSLCEGTNIIEFTAQKSKLGPDKILLKQVRAEIKYKKDEKQ